MLGDQMLRRSEVLRLVANHALLARHQHVKEVVDHDRHLDAINRNEHEPIVRLANLHLHEGRGTPDHARSRLRVRLSHKSGAAAQLPNATQNGPF